MEGPHTLGRQINMISNSYKRALNRALVEQGLTAPQSGFLAYLGHHQEDPPCQRDMEKLFNIGHPTATGILKRLEEKGYVRFEPDEEDRRLKRIRITPEGVALVDATKQAMDSADDYLIACLTAEEQETLGRLLEKIVERAMTEKKGKKDHENFPKDMEWNEKSVETGHEKSHTRD